MDTNGWKFDPIAYCPVCGKKAVYLNEGKDDYYAGAPHVCVSCCATGYMWTDVTTDDRSRELARAIKKNLED